MVIHNARNIPVNLITCINNRVSIKLTFLWCVNVTLHIIGCPATQLYSLYAASKTWNLISKSMSWNSTVLTLRCKQDLKNNFKINALQLNCTHTKLQARLEKEFQNLDPPTTQWTSVPVIACAVCTQLYFAGAAADVPILYILVESI